MRCAANFEVITSVSVVADNRVLTFNGHEGEFTARIKNIPRSEYTVPFLLSVHLYFEADSLDSATDVAEEHLKACLDMLAFTTGSSFQKHRIRQVVDAEPPNGAMRDVRMWGDRIEYEDPQPFLSEENARTVERLFEFQVPRGIQRALRWYRIGVNAAVLDDQYTYFWFALEIIAEFQKPSAKVNDKCPHCQSALYCEKCNSHPTHKPYPKQAIRALLMSIDKECDDQMVDLLEKTRNNLMHGKTLREIEASLPEPHESVVDILGRLVWTALVHQFPAGTFDGSLQMGQPSTYVGYKGTAVGHIRTIVPMDAEGHFDLDFKGMVMEMKPFGPPQSELPYSVRMSKEEFEELTALSYRKSEQQEMSKRICQRFQERDGYVYALVISTDMKIIRSAIGQGQAGEWVDLFSQFIDTAEVVHL